MRRPEVRVILWVLPLVLAGCATSAINMAPDRPDAPWTPATRANGEILPGEPASSGQPKSDTYVLPSNPALTNIPPPPKLDPGHAYTLPELIDIAQSNNPMTRVAWEDARNTALGAGIAAAAYLPSVSASVVGAYQTGNNHNAAVGTNVGSDVSGSATISAVSVQWLLFDFGQRAAVVSAAKQVSTMANIGFTAAHQQVIYRVSLAFYSHAAALAHVSTADKALVNAQQVQSAAEARYAHGVGTTVEVAQARQATAQCQLARVQAAGQAQDTYTTLTSAMGISPLTQFSIADLSQRKLSSAMVDPIEQIVSEALARRPDVLSAYAAHEVSIAKLRAAQAEFMPKLFLSATGSYVSGGLDVTALPGVGQESPTVNLSGNHLGATVLLGVTVPIYDGGTRRALEGQARADTVKTDFTLEQIRNEATRQIVAARNGVKTSLSALDASDALAAAAQVTFDAALGAYRSGVGSITDVTRAETQLLEARNAATDAYSTALAAAATLALSAGALGAAPQ